MNKDLLKYNVSELALSIGESCKALEYAIKSETEYGTNYYKENCRYWSERAVNAVYALGLNPDEACPMQSRWMKEF